MAGRRWGDVGFNDSKEAKGRANVSQVFWEMYIKRDASLGSRVQLHGAGINTDTEVWNEMSNLAFLFDSPWFEWWQFLESSSKIQVYVSITSHSKILKFKGWESKLNICQC